jgi:sialic acid synthase SpsE
MIVSTGMNGMDAIKKAINIIERADAPYALMHTTSLYPTPPQLVRLGAMVEMMDYFPGTPIGLSDHTMNNNACIAALGLGACIVERHFTDHRNRMGNDMICSMDEDELSQLLQAAREVYLMRGGKKEALVEEQVTTDFAFATVVTLTNVKAGDLFTRNNLWVKRPGIGELKAEEYDSILGNIAACDINKDTHINRSMIRVKS